MKAKALSRYTGTISGPPTDLDDFWHYLNCWADMDTYPERAIDNKRTAWGEGYQQAVRDIIKAFEGIHDVAL